MKCERDVTAMRSLILAGVVGVWMATLPAMAAEKPIGPVSVKVKSAKIRAEPKVWAASVVALAYGDSIEALSVTDGWLKVRARGKGGFIHESAVTTKKIVLSVKGNVGDGLTDRADVVLAGKGFNQAVEREFAAQDASLNFRAVDAMEKIKVSDAELAAFLQGGSLGKRG
jgi:hypothetical protein